MIIYFILFFLIILSYFVLKKVKHGKLYYCVFICMLLTLTAGLRNEEMGITDTLTYFKPTFENIYKNNLDYIWTLKDYGFQFLTYCFTRVFNNNFKLYTLLFTIPYMSAVSFFIFKYSNNPWFSFIIFYCLHYYEISFTLMRQINAMAFLIIGTSFLLNRKPVIFVLFVLMGSLFHSISILYLFVLIFYFLKLKKWMVLPIFLLIGIFLIFPQQILNLIFTFVQSDRFSSYADGERTKNLTFFLISFSIFIFELFSLNKIIKSKKYSIMFCCSSVSTVVSTLVVVMGEASRISYMFGISNIILLPFCFETCFAKNERNAIMLVSSTLLFVYFLFFLAPDNGLIPYRV